MFLATTILLERNALSVSHLAASYRNLFCGRPYHYDKHDKNL